MKPLSLRASLTAWFVGLTMLLLGGFSIALHSNLRRALFDGLDAELAARADGLFRLCDWDEDVGAMEFGQSPELVARLESEAAGRGFDVSTWPALQLVHRAGDALPSFTPEPGTDSAERPRLRLSTIEGTPRRRVCTLIARAPAVEASEEDPAKPAFEVLVRVSDSLAPVEAQLARVAWTTGGLVAVSLLVVLGFGLFLSRRFVRPLKQLESAAANVRAGTPTRMPRRGSADEVDQLAEILDRTFASLDESLQRQARFTANAAHELRTPITVIHNAAEVALRKERSVGEYREFLADVLATSDRMKSFVDALLTLARIDAGVLRSTFDDVDLMSIAKESAEAMARGPGRIRLTNGTPSLLRGEARLLRVLADNLLSNALRYADGKPVDVSVTKDARGRISLSVRDFGRGVPAEARKRVFERFYRVDEPRDDTASAGLGLAIVAEVARVHAAECELEDAAPGTRVTVRFPPA